MSIIRHKSFPSKDSTSSAPVHITVQRCLSTSEIVVQVRGLTTLFAEAVIFCFQDFDGNDEVLSLPDLIIISVYFSSVNT